MIGPDQIKLARAAYFRLGEILTQAEEGELPDATFQEGVDCLALVGVVLAGTESPELAELDAKARARVQGDA